MSDDSLSFKFAARVIDYFGSQAISTDEAAIFELIKNSRDANAKNIEITFDNILSNTNSTIIVYDNGDGMSIKDIKETWMVIGTDHRSIHTRTKKGKAVWGEKGVGRMACHKLGNQVNLLSVKNKERVDMDFDWRRYENTTKSFDEIKFKPTVKPTKEETGTTLTLTNLKSKWTSKRINNLKIELSRLIAKDSLDDIQIVIKTGNDPGETIGKRFSKLIESVTDHSPLKLQAKFHDGDLTIQILNQFDGKANWENQQLTNSRHFENSLVGNFTVNLFYLPRGPGKDQTHALEKYYERKIKPNGRESLEEFLEYQVGIYLHRDDAWMKPYGGLNDWLGMAENSVQNTGDVRLGQIYGTINMTQKGNPEIKTTSHRESMLKNQSFDDLIEIMRLILGEFSSYQKKWKKDIPIKKLKEIPGNTATNAEEGIDDMGKNLLKTIRGFKITPTQKVHVKQMVDGIVSLTKDQSENSKEEIKEMNKTRDFEKNLATLGIAASVTAKQVAGSLEANMELLREGEKMKLKIENEGRRLTSDEIKRSDTIIGYMKSNQDTMLHFMKFVNTLSDHISKSIESKTVQQVNVKKCWDTVSDGFKTDEAELDVDRGYESYIPAGFSGKPSEDLIVKFNKIDLECILTNFHLNSLTSLRKSKNPKKTITLHYWHSDGTLHLAFKDNGIGIPEKKLDEVFEPFKFGTNTNSRSKEMHGRGLGLYLVKEIVEKYGGQIKAVKTATGTKIELAIPEIKRVI